MARLFILALLGACIVSACKSTVSDAWDAFTEGTP